MRHIRYEEARFGYWAILALSVAACSTGPKEPGEHTETVGSTSQALDKGRGEVLLSEPPFEGVTLYRATVPTPLDFFESSGDRVALGDVDGDGQDEIVRGHLLGFVELFTKAGVSLPSSYLNGYEFTPNSEIRTGDVDGDGSDEIILELRPLGSGAGKLVIVPRPGHNIGGFFGLSPSEEPYIPFYGDSFDFTVCDLDGDGYDEIITIPDWNIYSHPSRPPIQLSEFFKYQPGHLPPPLLDGSRLLCADFDGNHRDDLVVMDPGYPPNHLGDFTFFSEPADGPQVVPDDPDAAWIFQKADRITAGDVLGTGKAVFVSGHLELTTSPDIPVDTGSILAFDVNGADVSHEVFGGDASLIYHQFGGDMAIRRRNRVDSDGDGLPDDWETNGIDGDGDGVADYFLPGALPGHKDIYVEVDAMGCSAGGCVPGDTHSNMPPVGVFDPVVIAFSNAPVSNPDGTSGITLHFIFDETLPVQTGCCFGHYTAACTTTPSCFQNIRNSHFGTTTEQGNAALLAAKKLAFHYVLFADRSPGTEDGVSIGPFYSWGGRRGTSNFIVYNNEPDVLSVTLMHELGHNLGLSHGGLDEVNHKPNYLSLMNYSYHTGLLNPVTNTHILDYSRKDLPDLWEKDGFEPDGGLDETKGVGDTSDVLSVRWKCPNGGAQETDMNSTSTSASNVDWNCNGSPNDKGVVSDLNGDRYCVFSASLQPLASTPESDDQIRGGTIHPNADGRLKSAYGPCTGYSSSDVKLGPTMQVIAAGSDGVLDTKICYTGKKNDDYYVNRIDPDPVTGRIDLPPGVTVAATDAPEYNTAGQLVRIRPGNDFTLETGALPGYPFVHELINPGANGIFDSDYVTNGFQAGKDRWLMDPSSDGVIVADDAILDTQVVPGDTVTDQYIIDGSNHICETTLVGPDVVGTLAQGENEPYPLRGYEDWHNLIYRFDPTIDVDNADAKGSPIPKEMPIDDLRALLDETKKADLGVTITASSATLKKGDTVIFHVTLSNAGPDNAKGAFATVQLPAGVTFSACSSTPPGACAVAGNTASINGSTLTAGTSLTADLTVPTDCSTPNGSFAANVKASATTSDPVSSNNAASASVGVATGAPVFLSVPPTITTTVCTGVQLGTPVVQNACGGTVTPTNNAPATFPLGTTVVTWTAIGPGGTTTATQSVVAKLGDSTTCCPAGSHVIVGTSNNDTLNGTAGVDCILGRGGQDHISGLGGDDVISGGDGDDVIDGGAGNDRIFGGTGQDNLTGGAGDDFIDGNDGDDICHGGLGNDTLHGGQGQDQLFGEDGTDSLFGDAGSDTLDGGTGTNYLQGDLGTDICKGVAASNQFVSCETLPNAPGATDLCADGAKDGAETAVDCGGGGCHGCGGGATCTLGADCLSQVCAGGVCTAPSSPLAVSLTVTSDWGPGYCATLSGYNSAATATTAWLTTLDTKGTSIYQTTKGTSTPASGIVTVTPVATELAVAPGTTNSNVSFCANRPTGNTTALAVVSSSSANY